MSTYATATQPDELPIEDIMTEIVDVLLDNEDAVNKDMPSPELKVQRI